MNPQFILLCLVCHYCLCYLQIFSLKLKYFILVLIWHAILKFKLCNFITILIKQKTIIRSYFAFREQFQFSSLPWLKVKAQLQSNIKFKIWLNCKIAFVCNSWKYQSKVIKKLFMKIFSMNAFLKDGEN